MHASHLENAREEGSIGMEVDMGKAWATMLRCLVHGIATSRAWVLGHGAKYELDNFPRVAVGR